MSIRVGDLETELDVGLLDFVLQCRVADLDRVSSVNDKMDTGHNGGRVIDRNATVSDRVDGATDCSRPKRRREQQPARPWQVVP